MANPARFWDRNAKRYARSPIADQDAYERKLEITRGYFTPESEVLEFGCGTGSTALLHAPHVRHILATDYAAGMLQIARQKASDQGIENVTFTQSSIEEFRTDRRFDAVLCLSLLHLVADRPAALARAFELLKPGGVLGVVEHRLPSSAEQSPHATSGYVHEDFVKALAAAAGFEFVGASDVNANPNDSADHPFGVWTLPPVSRTSDRDGNTPDGFDPAIYAGIGESDRMTLKFKKPDTAPSEPVE